MSKRKDFNKDTIINLYHKQKKSIDDCSRILNTTRITLSKWMRSNGIVIDSDRKSTNSVLEFSKEELEILYGCLLGDGHITKPIGHSCQFTYCSSEYEHVYFVYSFLKRFIVNEYIDGPKKYTHFDKRTNKNYTRYTIRTQSNITFYKLREQWYPNGTKIIPTTINFSPIILLFWYLGDGGLINGKYSQSIKLSTNAFSEKDLMFIQKNLKEFEPKIYGKTQKVIYIPRNNIKKFLDTIGPCPIQCYNHKWNYKEYKYEGCAGRQNKI